MKRGIGSADGVLGSPLRNLASILTFMAVVIVLATLAYMRAGWSLADASYMVALTIFTVGYGEVHPIDTPYLHAVTMGLMALGCTGMILLTSVLVQLFTLVQLREIFGGNRVKAEVDKLANHALICGYGRIGLMLARDLADAGMPLVVLERDPAKCADAIAAGHLAIAGDATEEAALIEAGIRRARVLATVLPNDAANVFITLSARNLAPRIEIIARGEVPTTESKLRHAGADQVVLPTHIGAERIARMILYPAQRMPIDEGRIIQIERELGAIGLGIEVVTVAEDCPLAHCSVAEAERRSAGLFMIAQIERDEGETLVQPCGDERIHPGDVVAIVTRDRAAAHRLFAVPTKSRAANSR